MGFVKLAQFQSFDSESFFEDKDLEVVGVKPWMDYEDKEKRLGTTIEVSIVEDRTIYITKPGEKVTNRYKKFNIKVEKIITNVSIGDIVKPVNPVATVYGEYRNQLSVKADDILVVKP